MEVSRLYPVSLTILQFDLGPDTPVFVSFILCRGAHGRPVVYHPLPAVRALAGKNTGFKCIMTVCACADHLIFLTYSCKAFMFYSGFLFTLALRRKRSERMMRTIICNI